MDTEQVEDHVQSIQVETPTGTKRGRREKKNISWTDYSNDYLMDLFIEQVKLGRKDEGGYTTEGWKEIERKMMEKFGDDYDKGKIRNRLRTLKTRYKQIKTLIGLSGFGWDDKEKKVTAEDQVWDDYVKVHPDYAKYRGKSCADYEKLVIIYGDTIADGRDVVLTNQRPPHPISSPQVPIDEVALQSSSDDMVECSKAPRTRKDTNANSRRNVRGEAKSDSEIVRAVKEMTATLVYVAEKLNQSGPSQADVVAAVQELELEKSVRGKALRMLRDPQASSQFLAFHTKEDRRDWILEELRDDI
ncbi:Myb/SANT-like domain-containing protein [Cinnamomum micranthum f. kanehirae]|uniref:Myb/SANT-like domain-containing protein n=1 Tax=Cinnamomum micranthum f. kanehirae TaxID=337451 RepID=A0A443N3R2_9MAGN|nr:Myb/SANT-like domain-containing protein [Cinnamomum micranthum f. kanehirae]